MVGAPRLEPATGDPALPDESGEQRRLWRAVAAVEVVAAAVVVLYDAFLPSLVLLVMAGVSLAVRRTGPASLGVRRVARPWVLVAQMLGVAIAMSLLNIGLLMPIANHASGRRQDLSGFADLEGDLALLALFIVLGWTLAAVVEEVAFRGFLLTRTAEVLGGTRVGIAVALVASSALFATLHTEQGLVGAVIAGTDALVYGLLRYWKSTLWAPVLAHGFVDTIGFVSFFFVGPIYGLW